jgi:hypothetical protein
MMLVCMYGGLDYGNDVNLNGSSQLAFNWPETSGKASDNNDNDFDDMVLINLTLLY